MKISVSLSTFADAPASRAARTRHISTVLVLVGAACAWAQSSEFRTPRVGTMLTADGSLRPVYGVAGSFLAGPVTARGILSAACSEKLCLAKTDAAIVSAESEVAAPAGPAVISPDGDAAWLYFPAAREFARWENGSLTRLNWRVDGEVLSIAPGGRVAVRRSGSVWIVRADGSALDALPEATGSVLLLHDAVVFAAGDQIVIQRPDRSQVRFPLPGIRSLAQMSGGWVQISAGAAAYALHVETGKEALYVLPASGNAPGPIPNRRR